MALVPRLLRGRGLRFCHAGSIQPSAVFQTLFLGHRANVIWAKSHALVWMHASNLFRGDLPRRVLEAEIPNLALGRNRNNSVLDVSFREFGVFAENP